MDVPGIVAEALGEEEVRAHVALEGPGVDALYVTPTRTLAYEDEGLLSDESVAEIPHDAERVVVSEGRRKATVRLSYGLDDDRELVVPARQVDEALHPLLAGVLAATGVIDDEAVRQTFRFSELTLVVTSDRVVKHVGGAVWDAEYDEIPFSEVRDLGVEEGSVSTQLVIETSARQERVKTPSDSARRVHADVEDALLTYHGVDSYEEFRDAVDEDAPASESADQEAPEDDEEADFAEAGLDPISMGGAEEAPEDSPADETAQAAPTEESGEATPAEATEADAGGQGARAGATPDPEAGGGSAEEPQSGSPQAASGAPDAGGADVAAEDAGVQEAAAADEGAADRGPDEFEGSPFESATAHESPDREAVEAELRALDEALARQAELIEDQRAAIEALIEELDVD